MTQRSGTRNNAKARHRGRNDGSIFKERNGKYRAMVTLLDGKRRSKTLQTKEECKNWIREMLTAQPIDEMNGSSASSWTVRSWFLEWLTQAKNQLRPNTLHDYERFSNRYILPTLGDFPLNELTRLQVNRFYHNLTEKREAWHFFCPPGPSHPAPCPGSRRTGEPDPVKPGHGATSREKKRRR